MGLPLVIDNVKRYPGSFMGSVTFDCVAAFLDGYDAAQSFGFLSGFREWLIVRADTGNNLAWSGLVLEVLRVRQTPDDSGSAIEGLFGLLEEFIAARDARDGLRRIYLQYENWLRRQSWYGPSDPNWVEISSHG